MKNKLVVLTVISAALLAAGCSTSTDSLGKKSINYHTDGTDSNNNVLEVPPDLTAPQGKNRYVIPGSKAASLAQQNAASQQQTTPATAASSGVLSNVDNVQMQRDGNQRWLLVKGKNAEEIWSMLKVFWQENGFVIKNEEPAAGVMETDWAENRAKLPNDSIRKLLESTGLGSVYSTPERDKFLIRLEKTQDGVEVYFSHRGLYETYTSEGTSSDTAWQPRPSDPNLEAIFLGRFMVSLGMSEEQASDTIKQNASVKVDARAKIDEQQLILTDDFDRAWRRVGLALDRIGLTVVDKDRSNGLYFVNPAQDDVSEGKKTSVLSSLAFWRSKDDTTAASSDKQNGEYRIFLKKEADDTTSLHLLDKQGAQVTGKLNKNILTKLQTELQ